MSHADFWDYSGGGSYMQHSDSDELMHYGVKGMKWHNHKAQIVQPRPGANQRDAIKKMAGTQTADQIANRVSIINKHAGAVAGAGNVGKNLARNAVSNTVNRYKKANAAKDKVKAAKAARAKDVANQIYNSQHEEKKRWDRARQLREKYIATNRKIHRAI